MAQPDIDQIKKEYNHRTIQYNTMHLLFTWVDRYSVSLNQKRRARLSSRLAPKAAAVGMLMATEASRSTTLLGAFGSEMLLSTAPEKIEPTSSGVLK